MYTATRAHAKIRSHTVFIMNRQAEAVGSGVLMILQDKYFVLSAAHVIDGDVDVGLGLFHPKTRLTIQHKWLDSERDIGYLELKPFEVTVFLGEINSPFKPRGTGPTEFPPMKTTFALSGFPIDRERNRKDRVEFEVLFITLPYLAFEQWPTVYREKYNPQESFILPFGPKHGGDFHDREDNIVRRINPRGLSGSGLWYFDPETENSESPKFSLVGIVHSYDEFYQVLIGTLITPLINKIQADYGVQLPILPDSAPDT